MRSSGIRRVQGIAVAMLLLWGTGVRAADPVAAPPVSIIPAPLEARPAAGEFVFGTQARVAYRGAGSEQAARSFVELAQRTHGIDLAFAGKEGAAGAILFEISRSAPAAPESYSLRVTPKGITVRARESRGLFYGAVSLWQLLGSPDAGPPRIRAVTIEDAPRFRWRGLMLDTARHYQSPEFIRKFIDWMALHKLNVFHWHLTDDQAWRLEIKKYPRLTSVGAWRVPAGPAAAADIDPATGKPRLYGGFYTHEEVRDIVKYAAARHITVVPEIELPGHASAAVVAYPQLGVSRTLPTAVPEEWGIFTTLFNADEATFAFFEDVFAEVMQLFPGEYIHVGGDEAVKDEWEASAAIQSRMKELGVKDEHALQSYFIQRVEKFLNKNGRKLIGWDEILEGGLAPNATVMSWRGIDGAIAAANAGHDTVLSPSPTMYLDHWQSDGDPAPGRSDTITLEDVYRFDPIPDKIPAAQHHHILGIQANFWAEFMRSEERVEYQAYPRAAALAEVAWSSPARIDWLDFRDRMPDQLARYRKLGIRYAPGAAAQPLEVRRRTSHQLAPCAGGYLLSLEDDAPLRDKRAVFLVSITNPCWTWKDADLTQITALRASVGQIPFAFQIGKDAMNIPLAKPADGAGELEVRLGTCEGELLAVLPLAPAVTNHAVTTLPPVELAGKTGKHDLCMRFTRASIDPIWTIDSIELLGL
jgi:hexosaminidase